MPISERKPKKEDIEFLTRVDAVILKQMRASDVTSQAIASCLCITSQQLRRKLKSILGVTSSAYIVKYRIDYAKRLLSATDYPVISEVSRQCGFVEPGNFARTFKNVTGMTPTQFCQQNQELK